jgi:hypothetical protein
MMTTTTIETMDWPDTVDRSGSQAVAIRIDLEMAKRLANRFILENLPDRFCAGTPRFLQFPLRSVWIVPVVLSYPRLGPVGQAGIAAVDTETGSVVGWTPLEEMKKTAEAIYERKKTDIEAAFSQARNA